MLKKMMGVVLACTTIFAASASPKVTLKGPGADNVSFDTIQAAIDSIKEKGEYTISLPKGTYQEVLYYNGPATIKLSGQTSAKYGSDVIIYECNDGDICLNKRASSAQKQRCIIEFEGDSNLILENLTVKNTFERGSIKGSNTQAETVGYDGTGFVAAYNCSFLSHQDTLRTTGKTWFYKCYVEGDTDFIWMEVTGKVALFEECEINAVYDEKHTTKIAYVGAPRMTIAPTAGKGLVIYNSKIITDPKQQTYFGRTPWRSGYYNQIAYINTKASGIEKEIWSGTPLLAPGVPENIIGWKMDSKTAKNLKLDTKTRKDIVSDSDVKVEFNGRDAIVNRYFDILSNCYRADTDTYWNLNSLAEKSGWKVSKDKSNAVQKADNENKKIVYNLDGSSDVSSFKLNGFNKEEGKPHFHGDAGSSLTIPAVGKAIVKVTGYYTGNGTIKAGTQGEVVYDFNTAATDTFATKYYVIYQDKADLTITADSSSYITQIVILKDDRLTFRPVNAIQVNTYKNRKEVQGKKTMQMSAILNPENPTNDQYVWSVSDPNAAEIDANGFLTAKAVKEDTVIKVIATSRDEKKVSGSRDLKIKKPEEGAFTVTYLNSEAASSSLEGTADEAVITALKAIPSKGTWKFNSSKITSDVAKGALSFSNYSGEIIGRDKVYIDFPIKANENIEITNIEVAFGNHGTSNMACQIMWLKGNDKGSIADDIDRQVRSTKKSYRVYPTVKANKGDTLTIRVILYGLNGTGDIPIPTGKAPTIGTVIVSGRAVK